MLTSPLTKIKSWTPEQRRAIEEIDTSMAVLAGAGSGKTDVLTHRIARILQENGGDLSQILAITFTEKAAWEMRERIHPLLTKEVQRALPTASIGTFHGIFGQIILEFAPLLGFNPQTSVLDPHTNALLMHQTVHEGLFALLKREHTAVLKLIEEFEFRNVVPLLEHCLQFRWHAEKHLMSEDPFLKDLRSVYQYICREYTSIKQANHQLDFQDLELYTLKLLQRFPEVRQQLTRRWKHILIDEMQDTNDLQNEIISLLFDPRFTRLFAVGDPKQSIYRFRGANVSAFLKTVEQIRTEGGAVVEPLDNFRSRPGILQFVNETFVDHFQKPIPYQPLRPTRSAKEAPAVLCMRISSPEKTDVLTLRKEEALQMAQVIQKNCKEEGRSFGDFVILFQAFSDVPLYEQALKENEIPYRLFGGRAFLQSQEVYDMMFCLKWAVSHEDRQSFVGLLRSPLIGCSDAEIVSLLKKKPLESKIPLLQFLHQNASSLAPHQMLEEMLAQTHYDWIVSQLDPSGGKMGNVEQFIGMARTAALKYHHSTADFVAFIENLQRDQTPVSGANTVDPLQDAVSIMTVHGAKGLQFPVVILPDLLRGSHTNPLPYLFLPESGFGFKVRGRTGLLDKREETEGFTRQKETEKTEDMEERKRLLYVAMTRAQEQLIFFLPPVDKTGGLWKKWIEASLEKHPASAQWIQSVCDTNVFDISVCDTSVCDTNEIKTEAPEILPPLPESQEKWRPLTVTHLKPKFEGGGMKGEGVCDTSVSALHTGTLVHQILKKYRPGFSIQQILKQEALSLHWNVEDRKETEILKMLERFLKSPIAPKQWGIYQEIPFRLKVSSTRVSVPAARFIVTGVIDFIEETPAGYIIYDFKTDMEIRKENYSLQMDLYAYALSQAVSKPVLETRLLFIRNLETVVELVTPLRLQRAEAILCERMAI